MLYTFCAFDSVYCISYLPITQMLFYAAAYNSKYDATLCLITRFNSNNEMFIKDMYYHAQNALPRTHFRS